MIDDSLEKCFPDKNIRIIAEPGSFFCETAFTLVSNVHSKNIKEDDKGDKTFHYFITDSFYQNFCLNLRPEFPLDMRVLSAKSSEAQQNSVVWGRSCDPLDVIAKNTKLPELHCGDWLVFENAGAYRRETCTSFHSFSMHPVHCFIEKEMW